MGPAFNLNQDEEDLALRKCHWINELIHVIWLNFQENAQNLAIQIVKDFNEHLKKRKFLKELVLYEFSIGDVSPKLINIESKIEDKDVIVDFNISYHGNSFINVGFDFKIADVPAKIDNIKIDLAKIRIILQDCNSRYPFFSQMKFAFVEDPIPKCNWDTHNLAGIAELPGFDELMLHFISEKLKKIVVLPEMITIPIKRKKISKKRPNQK